MYSHNVAAVGRFSNFHTALLYTLMLKTDGTHARFSLGLGVIKWVRVRPKFDFFCDCKTTYEEDTFSIFHGPLKVIFGTIFLSIFRYHNLQIIVTI